MAKTAGRGKGGGGKADILINMLSTPQCSNTVPKHKHKTPPHVPKKLYCYIVKGTEFFITCIK